MIGGFRTDATAYIGRITSRRRECRQRSRSKDLSVVETDLDASFRGRDGSDIEADSSGLPNVGGRTDPRAGAAWIPENVDDNLCCHLKTLSKVWLTALGV